MFCVFGVVSIVKKHDQKESLLISTNLKQIKQNKNYKEFVDFLQIKKQNNINLDIIQFKTLFNTHVTKDTHMIQVANKNFDINGIAYNQKPAIIKNCIFHHIDGAAVFTDSPLVLNNCKITNINSENGAIRASYNIAIRNTLFFKCKSSKQSPAFNQITTESYLKVNFTTMNSGSSDLFGSFYKKGVIGSNLINSCNATNNYASSCVGCFEVEGGFSIIKLSLLHHNGAHVHNGCAVFRKLDSLQIHSCVFSNNYHTSSEHFAASAILCYDTPSLTEFSNSLFLNNKRDKSFTVRLSEGKDIRVINCCFTGNKSQEIRVGSSTVFINTTFDTCQMWNCTILPKRVGYRKLNIFRSQVSIMNGIVLFLESALLPVILYFISMLIKPTIEKLTINNKNKIKYLGN